MKRIIIITCLLVMGTFQANAQFHFGGNFTVNFAKEHTDFSSGNTDNKELAYMINLKPKVYWNIGERMQAGSRIGFAFGRLTNGLVYDDKVVTTSNWDLHKGGFSGILQGLTDYGIGLVRNF